MNPSRRASRLIFVKALVPLLFGLGHLSMANAFSEPQGEARSDTDKFGNSISDNRTSVNRHWSLSLEAIALKRSNNSVNQSLINTVPAGTHYFETSSPVNSSELFNSNQFDYGFQVGPKITVNYRDDSGYGLEVSYFNVLNMNASNTVGPNDNWLTMYAPGSTPSFWQTQDYPYQGMKWSSTTNLYSAEANTKTKIGSNLRLSAGVRWIQLNDSLTGAVTPSDQSLPNWKTIPACGYNPTFSDLQNCSPGPIAKDEASNFSNYWTTSTTNNLFGLQVGGEGDVLNMGKLSLGGSLKAGVYDNRSTQSNWVSMAKQWYSASATRNRAAYVGDAQVQLKYRLPAGVAFKIGYQLLWLNQVALAPGQISHTYSVGGANPSLAATGVNTGSSIIFQGGTIGIEYSF